MGGTPHFWKPPYYILLTKAQCILILFLAPLTDPHTFSNPGKVQPEVKSAIGYSQADSYNNVTYAQHSYLNRPLSCAVDSAGDLIFADFNHRLRTVMEWFCCFDCFRSKCCCGDVAKS